MAQFRCGILPLRPDFTSKLVYVLAFGTPKFYIAPYDKIKHELVNLSSNCDVKSGLRVETGRYIGLTLNKRTCQICYSDETEDEMHFLFNCPRFYDLRQIFIAKSVETCEGFLSLSDEQKLKYLSEKHYVFVAKYIVTAMDRRKSYLYN